ncbi:Biopolymer transport protein ExbD/TolR [Rubripirellula lacrimiformis]|uniref:Biopolymer transport protein ExbD/TolR n=1 Tax=Rubripirellula lacrimiformis TaxID=1930273 RepID=A0A517N5M7_9BACT|nr:biopolymer transporter ExbD [Rubripirellula lacrimiformis]QDT02440.1 Biopolymer transport protein ExbD/TolR [Rubripirellula lacrimiformis]
MSIEVVCLQCSTIHHANDRMAGRRVRCPSCDAVVEVPQAAVASDDTMDDPMDAEPLEVIPVDVIPVDVVPVDVVPVDGDGVVPATAAVNAIAAASGSSSDSPPTDSIGATALTDPDDDEDDEVLVRNKRPEEEMDMTPMVDVTFLLLIFFMVTAAFSLQKSIEMPRQQTDAPSTNSDPEETEDLDMVELQVDEYGSFLVMAPDWERETPGKQNLISTLKEASGNNNDGMRLVIKVHEMAKLHALVDAMDAGTIAGYAQLEVTQVEEFD